jgi:peptide/nickel transport system permease protein
MPSSTRASVLRLQERGGKGRMGNVWRSLKGLRRYPSMVAGLVLILFFVVLSIYTVTAIPYSEAILLWRGGPGVWDEYPRNAVPVWFDLFYKESLSRTIVIPFEADTKTEQDIGGGMKRLEVALPFQFGYDTFPSGLSVFTRATAATAVTVSWRTPDGRTITREGEWQFRRSSDTYYISQDGVWRAQLDGVAPHVGLLADPEDMTRPLKGEHALVLTAELAEEDDLDARLVVYGMAHGLAGTDHRSRDLMVALLWGAPIGLLFGILAAIGAQVSTFVLSGIGTWMGGKVDRVFQWVTQVNLILPVLPILIMVGHFYSRSIWTMLGMIIALNVFSAAMLTYRAMFLQAKESPYIEAAQAYGAGNWRIIFRYLLPRIAPTLLPQFVLVIPTFVFLEATLAVLGLGDPTLPTWGKVLNDAYTQGALYKGYYYWILAPSLLLMTMGVGFALVGFALDRVFNPRLREV